jgi:hypothetical protein
MTYKGIVRGKTIELDESLPYTNGQAVNVSVEPVNGASPAGAPAAVRAAMRALPRVDPGAVDELEKTIRSARLPVRSQGEFDDRQ